MLNTVAEARGFYVCVCRLPAADPAMAGVHREHSSFRPFLCARAAGDLRERERGDKTQINGPGVPEILRGLAHATYGFSRAAKNTTAASLPLKINQRNKPQATAFRKFNGAVTRPGITGFCFLAELTRNSLQQSQAPPGADNQAQREQTPAPPPTSRQDAGEHRT